MYLKCISDVHFEMGAIPHEVRCSDFYFVFIFIITTLFVNKSCVFIEKTILVPSEIICSERAFVVAPASRSNSSTNNTVLTEISCKNIT